jgi:hypothetical protein
VGSTLRWRAAGGRGPGDIRAGGHVHARACVRTAARAGSQQQGETLHQRARKTLPAAAADEKKPH